MSYIRINFHYLEDMKIVGLITFQIIFYTNSFCQPNIKDVSRNMGWFIKKASLIMKKLEIDIRPNLRLDSPMIYSPDEHIENFNAQFFPGIIQLPLGALQDTDKRYYLGPILFTSLLFDSVINGYIDTNKITKIKAYSIIIHEVSHYLQKTYQDDIEKYFPIRNNDDVQYIKQPEEFEAYAVGAYFFLSYYNKELLDNIMRSKEAIKRKRELIVSVFRKKVYPWKVNGFD